MILGVGTDIIEVKRIARVMERHGQRFLDRIFTEAEQQYCGIKAYSERYYAARFAAKEAVVKALGTGFRGGISWLDIEISKNTLGKPGVILSLELSARFPSAIIHLSISHCHDYATATAVIEIINT